jgi:hypothetical protein
MLTVADDKTELKSTLDWILENGVPCRVNNWPESPPNIDEPNSLSPTSQPGLVLHWNERNPNGEAIAHFFDSSGFIVKISHRIPADAPSDLIWIDIGPGSPWK